MWKGPILCFFFFFVQLISFRSKSYNITHVYCLQCKCSQYGHVYFYSTVTEHSCLGKINTLPNDKLLDWSKLKAFADNKIKVLKMMIFENIVGKGENAGYQHFLFIPQCFQEFLLGVVKSRDCVVKS